MRSSSNNVAGGGGLRRPLVDHQTVARDSTPESRIAGQQALLVSVADPSSATTDPKAAASERAVTTPRPPSSTRKGAAVPFGMASATRPASASLRHPPARPGSARSRAGSGTLRHTMPASSGSATTTPPPEVASVDATAFGTAPLPLSVPAEMRQFSNLATERQRLIRSKQYREAIELRVEDAAPRSNVASHGTTTQSHGESAQPLMAPRRPGAPTATSATGTSSVPSLSQRPASARRLAEQRGTGAGGEDVDQSRFLDANAYNDVVVDPVVDRTASIGGAKAKFAIAESGSVRDEMRPCVIKSYDAATNVYVVEWLPVEPQPTADGGAPDRAVGTTRRLKPLSVQYGTETRSSYNARVERATRARDQEERRLRFHTYISNARDVDVLPWQEDSVERVLLLATGGNVPRHLAHVAANELDAITDTWQRGLRTSVVSRELRKGVSNSATATVMQLSVPPPRQLPPPESPLVAVTIPSGLYSRARGDFDAVESAPMRLVDFDVCRKHLARECFAARPELYRALAFCVASWRKYESRTLVDAHVPQTMAIPVELSDFARHQGKHAEATRHALHTEWANGVLDALQTELATTFRFFEDSMEAFQRSRAARFLRTVNLLLAGQVQGLVDRTLAKLGDWLETLVPPADMSGALDHDDDPAGFMALVGCRAGDIIEPYELRLRRKKKQPIAAETADDGDAASSFEDNDDDEDNSGDVAASAATNRTMVVVDTSIGRAVSGTVSILSVRLVVDEERGAMTFDPPLEDAAKEMRNLLSTVFDTTDGLSRLGPQFFPMLDDLGGSLTSHAQSLRDENPDAVRARTLLEQVITQNVRAAEAVCELFQPFEFVFRKSVDDLVNGFVDAEPAPTLDDYSRVCDHLQDLDRVVEERSLNEVVVPLFRLATGGAKQQIRNRLRDLVAAHLAHLIQVTSEMIDTIDAGYLAVHERLQEVPRTPEELRDLRAYLDTLPGIMLKLEDDLERVADRIHLLGKYGHMPQQSTFERYWLAYSWPRKVGMLSDDLPFLMQSYRAQFLNELRESIEATQRRIQDVTRRVNMLSFEDDELKVEINYKAVEAIEAELDELRETTDTCNQRERIFQQTLTRWPGLKEVVQQFEPHALLWRTVAESRQVDAWTETKLETVDADSIAQAHAVWSRDIARLAKVLALESPVAVVRAVKARLDAFKPFIPMALALAKPAVLNRRRHMLRLAEILGVPKFELREKTLSEIMSMGADKQLQRIEELSENADQEYKLETLLGKMRDEWNRASFTLQPFHDTFLLKDTDPLRLVADDHLAKTQAMLASPYAAAISHEVKPWFEKLVRMSQTLDGWLACQFGYRYLRPIFTGSDIALSLPEEARLFSSIDEHWRLIMEGTSKAPNVLTKSTDERLLPLFGECNAKLDRIMRQLAIFLDDKRDQFPRFYFLSNDDLISVLSETSDPTLVQPHMKKCFEGIARLTFVPDPEAEAFEEASPTLPNDDGHQHAPTKPAKVALMVTAMHSAEGETVPFTAAVRPATVNNASERWLGSVEKAMVTTVRRAINRAFDSFPFEAANAPLPVTSAGSTAGPSPALEQWLAKWPGMAVLTAMQLWWTSATEEGIVTNTLDDVARSVRSLLMQLVLMVRGKVDAVTMATLQALIVLQVHACDISDQLATVDRPSLTHFDWTAQLRYYRADAAAESVRGGGGNPVTAADQTVRVKQLFANIGFGFEYLGNSSRLVITPLTDRCYRTLTSAYHANYGGAPEGPAGTGKTETTKDLAKAIGKQCVVYNCSDQIKPSDMEKLLRGLAACGAWGCFDEFNRVELQVLSIIAQQVLSIQTSVAQKRVEFLFEGKLCALKDGCSMFVTMNPGYAGRSELPDNLKALFRPVAMMVPDYALIAENSLYSCGFLEASTLAGKIVATYKLCSEQLSSQGHYDYGMRAVKAVLSASQQLKGEMEGEPELAVVRRALFDVNRPKFLSVDAELFDGILDDLFGNIVAPAPDHEVLRRGLRAASNSWSLDLTHGFTAKALQIFEMIRVRHGVMVVGQTGSGKTACLKAVAAAASWAEETGEAEKSPVALSRTAVHYLNPKSVTMAQLYGYSDASGTDWHDGLLAQRFRDCAVDPSGTRHWIVLDGPVDARWIENMNTVLDDNKKLCLTNGDIIRMSSRMTMVFEAKDLAAASPATVSRCGMVYLEAAQLGWEPLLSAWATPAETGEAVPGDATDAADEDVDEEARAEALRERELCSLELSTETAQRFAYADSIASDAVVPSWLMSQHPVFVTTLKAMVKATVDSVYTLLTTNAVCATVVSLPLPCLVQSLLRLLAALTVDAFRDTNDESRESAKPMDMTAYAESIFVSALSMTFGAACRSHEGRALFVEWLGASVTFDATRRHPKFKALYHLTAPLSIPDGATVFDAHVTLPPILSGDARWVEWLPKEAVPGLSVASAEAVENAGATANWRNLNLVSLTVKTADTERIAFLSQLAIAQSLPVLLVGPTATGKTQVVRQVMTQVTSANSTDFAQLCAQFTATTTAATLQNVVDGALERRGVGHFAPPMGRSLLVLVDDLAMPEPDEYGTQAPLELLRQLLAEGGWFGETARDGSDPFRHIHGLRYIATAQPADGGRPPVCPRLARRFLVTSLPGHDEPTVRRILSALLETVTNRAGMPPNLRAIREGAVSFIVHVLDDVAARCLPTPARPHYLFNLRDMARVCQGVLSVHPQSMKDDGEFVTALVHEITRVACDRLTRREDQNAFHAIAARHLEKDLKRTYAQAVGTLPPAEANSPDADPSTLLLFGDFVQASLIAELEREARMKQLGIRRRKSSAHPGGSRRGSTAPVGEGSINHLDGHHQQHGDGSAAAADEDDDDRVYRRIVDMQTARVALERAQEAANTDVAFCKMGSSSLILFDYVVHHVARVARILQQPMGSALVVGLGGTGRRSVARLAAYVAGCTVRTTTPSRDYNLDAWRNDLGAALRAGGEKGVPTALLLLESSIRTEAMLEDCGTFLNTGEVPGVFNSDAYDSIVGNVRSAAKAAGRTDLSPERCWDFFVERCRINVHVVLCMSPLSESFRVRIQRFPALVNCMTVTHMGKWPAAGLDTVGHGLLGSSSILTDEKARVAVVAQAVSMYSDARDAFSTTSKLPVTMSITPSSFLDLLRAFTRLVESKDDELRAGRQRYVEGLETLLQTEKDVAELRKHLEANAPALIEATAKASELIGTVDAEAKVADQERAEVAEEEALANRIAETARGVKEECESDLAVARPALDAATQAVSSIDKKQLTELKSMTSPPEKVKRVMEAVCVLLSIAPKEVRNNATGKKDLDYWTVVKTKVMADVERFREMLIGYDRDNMSADIFEVKIKPYVSDRSFKPEAMRDVSQALVGVTQWVIAMETYYRVLKIVRPKQEKLREAEAEFNRAMAILTEKKALLEGVEARLANLRAQLAATIDEKERLEAEQLDTETKLGRAVKLLSLVSGEKDRYREQIETLSAATTTVVGDCLLAAGAVVLLGPLPLDIRTTLQERWELGAKTKEIVASSPFRLDQVLCDDLTVLQWQIHGLPSDRFSTESAVIATSTNRTPFLVDPQRQALRWFKAKESAREEKRRDHVASLRSQFQTATSKLQQAEINDKITAAEAALQAGGFVCVDAADGSLHATVITAVTEGHTLFVQDCGESVDPFLMPILAGQTTKTFDGKVLIALGEATVAFNPDFRLVLHTSHPAPAFLPEVTTVATVVGFFVTPAGLHEQVLLRTISHEERDMEAKRTRNIESSAASRVQLRAIEDGILETLAHDKNLLDGDGAINQLEASTRTSTNIGVRLQEIAQFNKVFDKTRARFDHTAKKSSELFFVAAALSAVNDAYEFSLPWFLQLYGRALEAKDTAADGDIDSPSAGRRHAADVAAEKQKRAGIILEAFIALMHSSLSRAMLGQDQLLLSFLLTASLSGADAAQVHFVASGGLSAIPLSGAAQGIGKPELVAADSWAALQRASDQLGGAFEGLARAVAADVSANGDRPPTMAAGPSSSFVKLVDAPLSELLGHDGELLPGVDVPAPYDRACGALRKTVIIGRCLRPELLVACVRDFVRGWEHDQQEKRAAAAGGANSGTAASSASLLAPATSSLGQLLADTPDTTTPIALVLSPGGDPMAALTALAEERNMSERLDTLSLGRGIAKRATELLDAARSGGRWLVLQNCHLFGDWMPTLDRIIEGYTAAAAAGRRSAHQHFRLWLTTMPSPAVPASLLLRSSKAVVEPPRGIKANLASTFASHPITDAMFFENNLRPQEWKVLCFSLCVMHAVLLARADYGAVGWNIPYKFNDADLAITLRQLHALLGGQAESDPKVAEKLVFSAKAAAAGVSEKDSASQAIIAATRVDMASVLASAAPVHPDGPQPIPFAALRYLAAQCNWGGRVTDAHDRELLVALTAHHVSEALLSTTGGFSFDESDPEAMPVPAPGPLHEFVSYIARLPDEASPELLGLHSNARTTKLRNDGGNLQRAALASLPRQMMVDAISGLTANAAQATAAASGRPIDASESVNKASPSSGSGADAVVAAVAETALSKVREAYDLDRIAKLKPASRLDASNTVLIHELGRFNRLITVVRRTSAALKRALAGEIVMSAELDGVRKAMTLGAVPDAWRKVSYPTTQPLAGYLNDLEDRLEMLDDWVEHGPPTVFWLGALMFPQAFITGVKQNYSRAVECPIDEVSWRFEVLNNSAPGATPVAGCYIGRLNLEGCHWDSAYQALCEPRDARTRVSFPPVHFIPYHARAEGELAGSPISPSRANAVTYACPMYRTEARRGELLTTGHSTNFIIDVVLPVAAPVVQAHPESGAAAAHLTKRGVALIASL